MNAKELEYVLCFRSFDNYVDRESYITLTANELSLFHSLKGHSHLFASKYGHLYWWDPFERPMQPEDDFNIHQGLKDNVMSFLQKKNQNYVMTFVVMDFYEIFDERGEYEWLCRMPVYHNIVLTQKQYVLFCSHPGLVFEVPEQRSAQPYLYWELHHSRVLAPDEDVKVDDDLLRQVLAQLVEMKDDK